MKQLAKNSNFNPPPLMVGALLPCLSIMKIDDNLKKATEISKLLMILQN